MIMSKGRLLFLTICLMGSLLLLPQPEDMVKAETRTAAGHANTFTTGSRQDTLLKVAAGNEAENLKILMNDKLGTFVPKFYGLVEKEDQKYVEIQDLTSAIPEPRIMDIKMGCRTFIEDEVTKVMNKVAEPVPHYYLKIIEQDPASISDREREIKAVTKARYMKWRDQFTTSASLGFRIEGIVFEDGTKKRDELRMVREESQVSELISEFIGGNPSIKAQYLNRLRNLRRVASKSRFFMNHEFIGSSLLFLHNQSAAGVWMIDLVQTSKLPDDIEMSHTGEWRMGNHEDCYLTGLDNIIHIISNLP